MGRRIVGLASIAALVVVSGGALHLALDAIGATAVPVVSPSPTPPRDSATTAAPTGATADGPNVVVILADDLRRDKVTRRYLPHVWSLAHRDDAVSFANAFVSNPLCCPSRTTLLTGRYSHTTGVWNNVGSTGGFDAFHDDDETIAVDFSHRGYRTALIGKYLNGYVVGEQDYVPPGWDRWFALNTGAYFNYPARTNDRLVRFGDRPEDYSSNVLAEKAVAFVENTGDRPFFLYLAFTAPHGPTRSLPRDYGRFEGEPDWPRPRTIGHSSLEAAYGMDRAIGVVLAALPENTVVLFTSDNGVLWRNSGREGKRWPYDPAVHVPMVLAGLDHAAATLRAGRRDLLLNVDLRVTLLHAAGLVPLSFQEGIDWFDPDYVARDHVLLEHGNPQFAYCGIRTATTLFARFADGTEEYYDYRTDPDGLRNIAADDPPDLGLLRREAKAECRPTPPGFDWATPPGGALAP